MEFGAIVLIALIASSVGCGWLRQVSIIEKLCKKPGSPVPKLTTIDPGCVCYGCDWMYAQQVQEVIYKRNFYNDYIIELKGVANNMAEIRDAELKGYLVKRIDFPFLFDHWVLIHFNFSKTFNNYMEDYSRHNYGGLGISIASRRLEVAKMFRKAHIEEYQTLTVGDEEIDQKLFRIRDELNSLPFLEYIATMPKLEIMKKIKNQAAKELQFTFQLDVQENPTKKAETETMIKEWNKCRSDTPRKCDLCRKWEKIVLINDFYKNEVIPPPYQPEQQQAPSYSPSSENPTPHH